MRLNACLLALCLAAGSFAAGSFAAGPLAAAEPAAPPKAAAPPTLAFKAGRWFDGAKFVPATWYAVNGRFTARRPARIDATVDLSGRYVLPPLAEAHNHDAQNAHNAGRAVEKNLGQGVFYSTQLCATPDDIKGFGGMMNQPGTLDVLFTGACITSSDGHPLGRAMYDAKTYGGDPTPEVLRRGWDVMDTLPDVERLWPKIAARKPALIKLILVNSERFAENRQKPELFGSNGLDPALIGPIVTHAHKDGVRVVVHAESTADFATVVAAGADFAAHIPHRFAPGMTAEDYRFSDAVIAEAARRGVTVMTTAGVARSYLRVFPKHTETLRAIQADNLRRLRAAGVRLAIGSDQFMGTVVDEILYLDGLKVMPRAELLRHATMNTPKILFPDRPIGGFGEGMEASLIAFDANPLDDLERLRSPRIRVKQGSLLSAPNNVTRP